MTSSFTTNSKAISSTLFGDADVGGAGRAVGEPALSFATHGELLPENSSRWLRNPGNAYARGNPIYIILRRLNRVTGVPSVPVPPSEPSRCAVSAPRTHIS